MHSCLRTSLPHGKQGRKEDAILPEHHPLRFWRVERVGKERMSVGIVHEDHEYTPTLEFGLLVVVQ
jgi:hypothetical protein